jgi:two-component system chemotaxis response regulator CheB
MTTRDLIVIGASAGGVEALHTLVRTVPPDLPAAVFVVIHTAADAPGLLAKLLDRASQLPVAYGVHGEPIRHSRVYVAPPNQHLLISDGAVVLSRGPRENRSRPAVDPLFRSAAKAYGNRVIGVVLSGYLDDGARGLLVIKKLGGLAVVQDPKDALYTGMPCSALEHVAVDHVLPVAEMAELFTRLTREPLAEGASLLTPQEELVPEGPRSQFVCPECGGSMREFQDNGLLVFRCHVGHAFAAQTLLDAQSQDVEAALWMALRTLDDQTALHRRLAENARVNNHQNLAASFDESAQDAARQAEAIRKVLLG